MTKVKYQTKNSHILVQMIKDFIGKLRQNPDMYPIRYYKKGRRFRKDFSAQP